MHNLTTETDQRYSSNSDQYTALLACAKEAVSHPIELSTRCNKTHTSWHGWASPPKASTAFSLKFTHAATNEPLFPSAEHATQSQQLTQTSQLPRVRTPPGRSPRGKLESWFIKCRASTSKNESLSASKARAGRVVGLAREAERSDGG